MSSQNRSMRKVIRTVYISLPLWQEYRSILMKESISISQHIERLIHDYVEKHGHGNPAFPLDKWLDDDGFLAFPTLGEDARLDVLRNLPDDMLQTLARNAEAYYQNANHILRMRLRHRGHQDLPDPECPLCR